MTVGQALERAEELRPGSRIALATRQAWLKEADAMLRNAFLKTASQMHTTMWAQTLHGMTACRMKMSCWLRHPLTQCIPTICVP